MRSRCIRLPKHGGLSILSQAVQVTARPRRNMRRDYDARGDRYPCLTPRIIMTL